MNLHIFRYIVMDINTFLKYKAHIAKCDVPSDFMFFDSLSNLLFMILFKKLYEAR